MDINTLLKPVVGAVIGYSTNWLAIKMLFKPHTAKYIGKFQIPFTPGLIPRERARIAGSLGTAVGEQLLTETVISKELLDDKVKDHIRSYVVKEILANDFSVKEVLEPMLGDDYAVVVGKVVDAIEKQIEISKNDYLNSNGLKTELKTFFKEKYPYEMVVGSVIPVHIYDDLDNIIANHKDRISQFIVDETKSEEVINKLKTIISDLIMEKVGALGAMFVNPDDMVVSILGYIEKVVFEEETQAAIVKTFSKAVREGAKSQLSDLVNEEQYNAMINGAGDYVVEGVKEIALKFDMKPVVNKMVNHFLEAPITLTDYEKERIGNQVEVLYENFINENISTFLETFELKSVVEKEINTFSVDEIEQLIFAIVDKELQAITWFGALLGFVMGLIMLVL